LDDAPADRWELDSFRRAIRQRRVELVQRRNEKGVARLLLLLLLLAMLRALRLRATSKVVLEASRMRHRKRLLCTLIE
jgi:hypothetical protein